MFLRNWLGRSNDESTDLQKYDRLTFSININENIPEISDEAKGPHDEEHEISPNHPLYSEIFQKEVKEPEPVQEYVTKEDDTLVGIALKLNISEEIIKNLNGFSGDMLFPKMRIKIPANADMNLLETKTNNEPSNRVKISELFLKESDTKPTAKYDLYYCAGAAGNIRGMLNIHPNYIMFNPLLEHEENKANFTMYKILKFNAIIYIYDIKYVVALELPVMVEGEYPEKEYQVQMLLFKIGNKKIEDKYKERLRQLKVDHKAIASISFKVPKGETDGKDIQTEICAKISSMIKPTGPEQGSHEQGLTNIPFFDILYHNIASKRSLKNSEEPTSETTLQLYKKKSLVTIKLNGYSMLPHEAFVYVAAYFPLLYQLHNWSLIYSTMRDGTSYNTMMRKCANTDPLLLMVKEYKGNVIGAYLPEALAMGKTGRGYMFIWRWDTINNKVDVYGWTGYSYFFCFADSDGLGIGMGIKYGIYLNSKLEKGHSGATKTFTNEVSLSQKEDFYIENVEVWGIDTDDY